MTPAERAAFVEKACAALPNRFRVVEEDGVFFLLDPDGDHIANTEDADDELLSCWVAEANARLAQGLYREGREPTLDLPLSLILAKLERGDMTADEQRSHLPEAVRQASQLESYYTRESAACQRRQKLTLLGSIAAVVIAWIIIGLGPEPDGRPIVTQVGRVAFWIWLLVPVLALLASAIRRRISVAEAVIFSVLWSVAAVSLAVALQVVSGWFFYAL
jgi:hypothetical protein